MENYWWLVSWGCFFLGFEAVIRKCSNVHGVIWYCDQMMSHGSLFADEKDMIPCHFVILQPIDSICLCCQGSCQFLYCQLDMLFVLRFFRLWSNDVSLKSICRWGERWDQVTLLFYNLDILAFLCTVLSTAFLCAVRNIVPPVIIDPWCAYHCSTSQPFPTSPSHTWFLYHPFTL